MCIYPCPILGPVGVEVKYEMMPQTQARWAMAGWEAVDQALSDRKLLNVKALVDIYGRPVLLFSSE